MCIMSTLYGEAHNKTNQTLVLYTITHKTEFNQIQTSYFTN